MKRAFAASSLFVLVCWAACNTRTPIGVVDGAAGSGAAGVMSTAGIDGFAGVMNTAGIDGFAGAAGGFAGAAGGSAGEPSGAAGVGAAGDTCPMQSPTTTLFQAATPIPYPSDSIPSVIALGDLNGDGAADVVIGGFDIPPPVSGSAGGGAAGASGLQGSVEVALTTKAGGFAPAVRYGHLGPAFLGIADLNGDKLLDVTSVSGAGPITLLNTGAGTLGAPTSYSVTNPIDAFTTGDFDGDGKAELVFANNNGPGVTILKSAGGSDFAAHSYDNGSSPNGIAVGEVDGHPGVDLVVVSQSGVQVFANDGSGNLGGPTSFDGSLNSVALADIDGDGKLDIVGQGYGVRGYVVLINLGGGAFAVPRELPLGDASGVAAFGDVNGDGKVDAVISNAACSSLAVYLNDGSASFAAPSYIPSPAQLGGFALGDVNGDKALDLVFFTATGVGVQLHR